MGIVPHCDNCWRRALRPGKNEASKVVLFLAALAGSAFILSAPLFNADEKYKAVEMDQQVEIKGVRRNENACKCTAAIRSE